MSCSYCVVVLPNYIVVCANCGHVVDKIRLDSISPCGSKDKGGVSIAARVFTIIGYVVNFFLFILRWYLDISTYPYVY